jgi:hypothetical protein
MFSQLFKKQWSIYIPYKQNEIHVYEGTMYGSLHEFSQLKNIQLHALNKEYY